MRTTCLRLFHEAPVTQPKEILGSVDVTGCFSGDACCRQKGAFLFRNGQEGVTPRARLAVACPKIGPSTPRAGEGFFVEALLAAR